MSHLFQSKLHPTQNWSLHQIFVSSNVWKNQRLFINKLDSNAINAKTLQFDLFLMFFQGKICGKDYNRDQSLKKRQTEFKLATKAKL